MKSKIILGLAVMFVLLMTVSQPALAYVYPDPPQKATGGFGFSPWIVIVAVAVLVAIVVVARLKRSRKDN